MRTKDLGLLLLRAGVGGTLAAHGVQKLRNREAVTGAFGQLGFARPDQAVLAAAACEVGGGALLAVGAATPAAGAAAVGAMTVAVDVHRANGFFAQQGGSEFPLALGVGAAALALTGPGRWSVDRMLGHRLARPWMAVAGCAVGVTAGAAVARSRRVPDTEDDTVVDVRDPDSQEVEVADIEVARR